MGSRRDQLLVFLLVVIILLLSFVASTREQDGPGQFRPSTFLSGDGGARALRLVLEELEVETRQRLTPYADADPLAGPLAVLAPSEGASPGELHALAEWVRGGGTLLYAARQGDVTLDTLGLALQSLGDSLDSWEQLGWAGRGATALPHRWTEGVAVVDGFRYAFADSSRVL
ncbi:MAG TPA: DUF4350 domain-containing protein, partial [Longimicrobiaceae bacterium]|nr:DUF4350 domain-containing protein [Longimicrobiaceae bacterium]